MELIIPDASVILKWIFTHEEYSRQALLLRTHYLNGQVKLTIPAFALYEISNVLSLPKTGYTARQSEEAIKSILRMGIPVKHFGYRLFVLSIQMAYAYKVSVYDACYLVLANKHKGKWLTADKKAYLKVKQLSYVVWIEDYK